MGPATLIVIGLGLNMIGVLIIFIYGPPQPSFREGSALLLEDDTPTSSGKTAGDEASDTKKRLKFYSYMSKLGLGFIFCGFALQFYSALCT